MRKTVPLFALALLASIPASAGPVEEVTAAETAFAKAFADRDTDRFFAMVLEDATFLGKSTLSGKKAVREKWSKFFEPKSAPFSWKPDRVVASGDGSLGLSSGPVFDSEGNHVGNFASVWRKQKDGSWKIQFDGPGGDVCPEPPSAPAKLVPQPKPAS